METPPIPDNDDDRVKALHACFLLDTDKEEGFDRVTRLAQRYFNTKMALVSFVDVDRQWFKSNQGLDAEETSRGVSFCGHAINNEEVFVVEDATKDKRLFDNPLVMDAPNIRFYAGAPLHSNDGYRIGTLCIIDDQARVFTENDASALRDMANTVESEILLRSTQRHSAGLSTLATISTLDDKTLSDQLRAALKAGCDYLGLEFGIVSNIDQDSNSYAILVQHSPPDTLNDHQVFPFNRTYCDLTIKQRDVLDIAQMGTSPYSGHPCYKDFQFESYIGIPLIVDNEVYGTLNFSSANPRTARSFFAEDREFVRLFAHWVTKAIKRDQLDEALAAHQKLDAAISHAQTQFIAGSERQKGFDCLLSDTLALTKSEYGFIGEVLFNKENAPYLKTYSITNIAGDNDTRDFYDTNAPQGLEFSNLDTLFGAALRTGAPVIANHAPTDSRSGGLPKGHPPLHSFLGIPIYHANHLVAMIGVANRPSGYKQEQIKFLEPLLTSIGQLVEASRNDSQRKEGERRLTDIIEATQLATWEWNLKTEEASVNKQWAKIIGYKLEELLPITYEKWAELVQPDDLKHADYALKQHLSGESPSYNVEYRMRHKDGSWIWVHDQGRIISRDHDGNPEFMSGMRQDVNERHRSKSQLKEQAAHTQAILDTMADGLVTYDEAGIIESLNSAAQNIFGYDNSEAKDQDICLLLANENRAQASQQMMMVNPPSAANDTNKKFQIEGLRKNGKEFAMEVSISILRKQEKPLYVAVLQDISERKRMERMKNEFVSTVSHELRTPLTSISGAIGLVLKNADQELSPSARKMINIAYKNCHRLTLLINDLLDMEKLEAGKLQFDMMPQPLMPLVEQAVEAISPSGDARNIKVIISTSIPEAKIMVDSDRFTQVITNFLSNAIKFSPPNGRVVVSASIENGSAEVSVQDYGPGISKEFSTRVFQKFAQADSSDTRDKGGTGLGLAISQEL
ncbi:MAG: PAS domain S-box protein, partial [Pseudomonadales bacterium]|nr:PAS domain S-box protein [Pseudomonadales bacterium]